MDMIGWVVLTLTIGSVALEKSNDWSCDKVKLSTLPRWASMVLRRSYVSRLYTCPVQPRFPTCCVPAYQYLSPLCACKDGFGRNGESEDGLVVLHAMHQLGGPARP